MRSTPARWQRRKRRSTAPVSVLFFPPPARGSSSNGKRRAGQNSACVTQGSVYSMLACLAAFLVCAGAIAATRSGSLIFAASCGFGMFCAVFLVRRLNLGRWGAGAIGVTASVIAIALVSGAARAQCRSALGFRQKGTGLHRVDATHPGGHAVPRRRSGYVWIAIADLPLYRRRLAGRATR